MFSFKRTFFGTFMTLLSVSSSIAQADDIFVSANRGTRDDIFANVGTDVVRASLQANRSYACVVLNREYDSAIPKRFPIFNTTVTAPNNSTFQATATGTMLPGIATPANLIAFQARTRISFVTTQSGVHSFTLADAQAGGTAVPGTTIRCNDTTLYGGYNRLFAEVAIVELTNNTSESVLAFISIIDSAGTVLVDNQQVRSPGNNNGINANGREDVIFVNLPAGNYGQILVTYAGSLGAISGYVAEYDFDSSTASGLRLKKDRAMELTPVLP